MILQARLNDKANKKIKRNICGLGPADIKPPSERPKFEPLCDMPMFKHSLL